MISEKLRKTPLCQRRLKPMRILPLFHGVLGTALFTCYVKPATLKKS